MAVSLARLETAPDLVDQVYRRLLDAISNGSMAPGTRLTQEEVAERLCVSRQPVLQALRQLKADGLVRDAQGLHGSKGRGVVVAPLNVPLIGHIYQVRAALDVLAARLAAQHRAELPLSLVAQGREAATSGDIQALMNADLAFHRAIYQASGNPLIADSALLHWCHIRRAMGEALRVSALRASVWDEHEALAQAIARGDAEQAATLADSHCTQASRNLVQQLEVRLAQQAQSPGTKVNSVAR